MGLTDAGLTVERDDGQPLDLPPTISSTPTPSFIEGTGSTYDFTANVSDDGRSAVTYSLTNTLPNGLTLNTSTGILTYDGIGVPSVSQHQLTATDAVGSAQSDSFNVSIVDEAFIHGDAYIINGSGFGTRDDNNPNNYTWEGGNFICGAVCDFSTFPSDGSSLATFKTALGGFWPKSPGFETNPSTAGMTQQSGGPSQAGTYSRSAYTVANGRLIGFSLSALPGGSPMELYVSFKIRQPSTSDHGGKFFRRWFSGGSPGTGNTFVLTQTPSGGVRQLKITTENAPCTVTPVLEGGGPGPIGQNVTFTSDVWQHFEIVCDDGLRFEIYVDGVLVSWDNSVIDPVTIPTLQCSEFNATGTIDVPHMVQDHEPPIEENVNDWYDVTDIFIDYTTKRIVMTDTSVYANRTLTEPQVPTSWSDTSITIKINRGEHSIGTKYLHYVDQVGASSLLGPIELVAG